jgi:uncharacterized protein YndB with AHSA1/START domain
MPTSLNKSLIISMTVEIHAGIHRVWDTLTNPQKNGQFFSGTQILTDWKVGSPILFQGEFQGQKYTDRGHVLEAQPGKILRYDYWTGFSGLDDLPENYSMLTYTLTGVDQTTHLAFTRVGFATEQEYQYALAGWEQVLEKIKHLSEAG